MAYAQDWRSFCYLPAVGTRPAAPAAVFAAELRSLPDYWDADRDQRDDLLQQVLLRQSEFVSALAAVPEAATFELRFLRDPHSSRPLRIVLLASVEEADHLEAVWNLFHSSFPADLDIRLDLLSAADVAAVLDRESAPRTVYEWVPQPRSVPLSPQLHEVTFPPAPRLTARTAVIRGLQQSSLPLTLGYAVQPLDADASLVTEALQSSYHALQRAEALLRLANSVGGLQELQQRDDPFLPQLLEQLGSTARLDQPTRQLIEQALRHLQRDHYELNPTYLLEQVVAAAQRFLTAHTYFLWRVHLTLPADRSLDTLIPQIIAADLATDGAGMVAAPYQMCAPVLPRIALDNMRWVRARLTRSVTRQADETYLPRGEVIDHIAATAVLQVPVLPKGGIPGLPAHQANPFSTWQGTRPDQSGIVLGRYIDSRLGVLPQGNRFTVPVHDLTRHTLIAGSTGSGKSTTTRRLLTEIHRQRIPFLVVEPAKSEYADLVFSDEFASLTPSLALQVDRPGSIDAPMWFNPFFIRAGQTLATHVSYLMSCFSAAFPLPGVFEIILNQILYAAYEKKYQTLRGADDQKQQKPGGDLFQEPGFLQHNLPFSRSWPDDHYPNLDDLIAAAEHVIDGLGYRGEFASTLRAAIPLRLAMLKRGSVGAALRAVPDLPSFEADLTGMLRRTMVIQFAHIAEKNEKALLMAFLLVAMYAYYEGQPDSVDVRHVTVVEEAHVLLENVSRAHSSDESNTRGKAIDLFVDMLAEIRSRGEGLIIVEQLPSKLVPEAIKNTNLKIMHRLPAYDDREVLGNAMSFDQHQSRYATTLERGQAIVYREGLTRPALITVDALPVNSSLRLHVEARISRLPMSAEGRRQLPVALRTWLSLNQNQRAEPVQLDTLLRSLLQALALPPGLSLQQRITALAWFAQRLLMARPQVQRRLQQLLAALTPEQCAAVLNEPQR